jgi:alpha-ribazole phosphatase
MNVYLVRHGETQWVAEDRFTGISDIELTGTGQMQAARVAKYLHAVPITAIYSSPLKRCRTTAQIINTQHLSIQVDDRLREINYGVWEGMQREDIKRQYAQEFSDWGRDPAHLAPARGETGVAVLERVSACWRELQERHGQETIVIVAHKTVNRILLCWLLGISIQDYRRRIGQDACGINIIQLGEYGPLVQKMNYTV